MVVTGCSKSVQTSNTCDKYGITWHIADVLVIGALVIDTVMLQAPKSRVPTFPRQIDHVDTNLIFVMGLNTARCKLTRKGDFVPVANYDVTRT